MSSSSSSSTSAGKKKFVFNTVAVDLGCGSCRKPKKLLSSIFHPKPAKPTYRKHHNYKNPYFSTTATATATATVNPNTTSYSYYPSSSSASPYDSSVPTTAATFSPDEDDESCAARPVRGFGRVGGESVAVEKDSDDPYLDFRQSMLQMILEKQIYSRDDLRELLCCFLQLNSPYHHGIIVRAFTEIWNGVFSSSSSSGKSPSAAAGGSGGVVSTPPRQGWGQYSNYGYYQHGWN